MIKENNSTKDNLILFTWLLFVYIVLFEFILPINKIIPKPTLLFESLIHIWRDYNLVFAFTTTASIIYLALICCWVYLYMGYSHYLRSDIFIKNSFNSLRYFKYLTVFFFAILFNFWFPNNLFGEFFFTFIIATFWSGKKLLEESKRVNEEYILVARNLGLTSIDICEMVYWKASLPALSNNIKRIHYYLWVVVLTYEFIGNFYGLGSIYRTIVAYNDFTALFVLAIMTSLIIWFGDYLIGLIIKRTIHWTK
jgi:ABC-type nitrate/sulfonate/bicarbonate transport system permease component